MKHIISFLSMLTPKHLRCSCKQELLQHLYRYLIISVACVFLLLLCNRILFPCYRQIFAQDLEIELIATGEKSEESLYNNVRLSKVTCNGKPLDLSQIPLDSNWQYAETGDFLYNYNTHTPNRIVIDIEDAISVDMIFVSECGSGIVQIIVNGEELKPVDLYSNESWSYLSVRYDTSPFVHPEQHPIIFLIILLVIFTLICCISAVFPAKHILCCADASSAVLLQGILAFLLMLSCVFIQYQNPTAMEEYRTNDYLIHIEGYIIVFLPLFLLYCFTRSHWLSFGIVASVLYILHLVSGIKESARGTPLLPWDFQIVGAALSVSKGYDLSISFMSIVTLLCSIVVVLSLFICRSKFRKLQWSHTIFNGIACATMLILFFQTTVVCGVWGSTSDSRVYQVSDYYSKNGFLVSFFEYTNYLNPQDPPEGYSKESMQQLSDQITSNLGDSETNDTTKTELPNIIAIMSESYWDVTSLENIVFEEDPLSVYRSLSGECMSGDLLSHVFGGNTVISEFEFLTGFHAAFFPSDFMVYGSCLGNNFASAASILRDQGYHTVALHPYESTNYNRNTAYKSLGFEEMLFEDSFPADSERIRTYISDDAMYQKIEQQFEQLQKTSDNPLFLFGITMQNHGGYWPETLYTPTAVNFTAEGYQDSTVECMADYFSGIRSSDIALGNLISYFQNVDEDTIIIYFGDHMSDAGTKAEKMFSVQSWYQESTFAVDVRSHTVPYLVWSNCGITPGEQPIMDISMLMPSVLAQTDVQIPPFWQYLLDQKALCSAFNSAISVNADMSGHSLSELDYDAQVYLDTYRMLTYDYVWGNRYAQDLWSIS